MNGTKKYDVVVVGSGPNGMAAAIYAAKAGRSVVVYEAKATPGGGTRTEELTLPGFYHDVCSAAHPMGAASPFFRSLPLEKFGLKWIRSPAVLAHPFDDGTAALLSTSVEETARQFPLDEKTYQKFFNPLVRRWQDLFDESMGPAVHFPRHPLLLARFGIPSLFSATAFARHYFKDPKNQALFAGIAAHSSAPLTSFASAAVGLMLQIAGHAVGWPIVQGGSQNLTKALVGLFESLGGQVVTNYPIRSMNDLPPCDTAIFDLTPRQILEIAPNHLAAKKRNQLSKFQYGPGVFKMDWALSAPIPWTATDCLKAATVHLGGTLEELTVSEQSVADGRHCDRPYILLGQPSLFDTSRAPVNQHTVWAYCHVPNGSTHDMTGVIENQIERFAPGFKRLILKRRTLFPKDLEAHNANIIGGDIAGGRTSGAQLFFRPTKSLCPYDLGATAPKIFICSSSTPPGPGVHGMGGYHAAKRALG